MTKLFKYLKKSSPIILFIVVLLVLQAYCDLSLPSYTSDIVNVGIQQGGIESPVPEVIRKSQMELLLTLLSEEETEIISDSYELWSEDTLSESEYEESVSEYPLLQKEALYHLTDVSSEEEEELADILAKPLMTLYYMSQMQGSTETENAQTDTTQTTAETSVASGADTAQAGLSQSVGSFSQEEIEAIPETIVNQAAIAYVKAEYTEIGIDLNQIQTEYILMTGLKMLGLAAFTMILAIVVTFFAARIAAALSQNLREMVFHKVVGFSNQEFDQYSTASLITRSTNDIQQVQMVLMLMFRMVFYAPILGIGGVIKVFHTNTSMAWIIGVAVGTIIIVVAFLFAFAMPKFKIMQTLVDRLNLVSREILTGLPVIRAFHTEQYEEKRFDTANKDLTKVGLFINRVMSCMMPIMMLIMNLITVLIVWSGAHGIEEGSMQVGDMMAFIQYTMQIIMSFLMLSMISIMLPRASVSARRIDEVINTPVVIHDPKQPQQADQNKRGLIEFKNVNFAYPKAQENVLQNISFTAKPGQTTAIIGSTGSGKSTLIQLIPRFFDISAGEILVDGVNVKNLTQQNLRSRIGYVPQKGVLFSGDIESNIKFSDETLTDEQMEKAARIAQAAEFIEAKPERYHTAISQGGNNVSGGQKQRLSIARAIAKDPEIFIFDDSFSALDYKTDVLLRKALGEEIKDSTVIIVAQRINTILHADQIIVLDEGAVVGIGKHQELLSSCEVYKQIALSQFSEEEIDKQMKEGMQHE